jgi:hypothetical protein
MTFPLDNSIYIWSLAGECSRLMIGCLTVLLAYSNLGLKRVQYNGLLVVHDVPAHPLNNVHCLVGFRFSEIKCALNMIIR